MEESDKTTLKEGNVTFVEAGSLPKQTVTWNDTEKIITVCKADWVLRETDTEWVFKEKNNGGK